MLVLAACSGGDGDSGSQAQANDAESTVAENIPPVADEPAAETITEDEPAEQPSQPNAEIPADDTTNAEPETALPLNDAGEQLVARVNGEDITLSEFEEIFDRQQYPNDAASYDALANALLDTIIEQRLINQAAAQMNITVTDDEVNAELERNRSQMGDNDAWQAWLAENNFTEDTLRGSLRDWLITQRMQQEIIQVELSEVTEVRARHIVVQTEAEANNVLARLDGGEGFEALAAELSRDVTTRDSGGDLGWFDADTLLVPELSAVVFQMQIGEVRGPVQTMLGYHVVQLMDVQTREAADSDAFNAAFDQFTDWLEAQRSAATIERYIN